jgi:hypothetical protein
MASPLDSIKIATLATVLDDEATKEIDSISR